MILPFLHGCFRVVWHISPLSELACHQLSQRSALKTSHVTL